jgi:hypothetical protein
LPSTSLGRRIPNDRFPHEVARVLRAAANQSRGSFGDSPFLDNHFHALNELADLVLAGGLEDQLVRSLSLTQAYSGGSSDTWDPGEHAQQLIAGCGYGPAAPSAEESLAELVSFAVEDLGESQRAADRSGAKAQKRIGQLEESNQTMSQELAAAKEREQELDAQLADARQQESELRAKANHLRRALDAAATARPSADTKAKPEKPKAPRRVRVEGAENEGIYTVTKKVGPAEWDTRFEIGYRDAEGRQRWLRLDHTDIEKGPSTLSCTIAPSPRSPPPREHGKAGIRGDLAGRRWRAAHEARCRCCRAGA